MNDINYVKMAEKGFAPVASGDIQMMEFALKKYIEKAGEIRIYPITTDKNERSSYVFFVKD